MKDQWDFVLNDLEELGDKKFLVLTSQYNIEIFSHGLRVLPFCSSIFHQTNAESSQSRTEDNLLISRIQLLHLLLDVDDHDVLFVAQVRDQLFQSMRNYDPRVRIVFVYRFNSDFHSIFTLQVAGCDF